MRKMMRKLMEASDPFEGYASVAYTSVLVPAERNDDCHRYWFVADQIAETHLGLHLPNPLKPLEVASGKCKPRASAREEGALGFHEGHQEAITVGSGDQKPAVVAFYEGGVVKKDGVVVPGLVCWDGVFVDWTTSAMC